MAGYCIVHLLEHTISAHFHYGEETHHDEFVSRRTGISVLGGLSVHALFDGVAIGSGFVVSNALGWLIFLAIFLHKAPEGFTMACVMLASGRSRIIGLLLCCRTWRRQRSLGVGVIEVGARLAALWLADLRGRGALCGRKRPGAGSQSRAGNSHGAGVLCGRRRVSAAENAAAPGLTAAILGVCGSMALPTRNRHVRWFYYY